MVSSEDDRHLALRAGPIHSGHPRDLNSNFLQPPERTSRFDQLSLPSRGTFHGAVIGFRDTGRDGQHGIFDRIRLCAC
jgi:hypothetical protein